MSFNRTIEIYVVDLNPLHEVVDCTLQGACLYVGRTSFDSVGRWDGEQLELSSVFVYRFRPRHT